MNLDGEVVYWSAILSEGVSDDKVINDERIAHMHGVAEVMYDYCNNFGCNRTPDEMYIVGLLHDVGYLSGKEGHESKGAELVSNPADQYLIRYHGCVPSEVPTITPELRLLWFADLMVESAGPNAGKVVGFEERLKGIAERYGEDSKAYKVVKETVDYLVSYLENMCQ